MPEQDFLNEITSTNWKAFKGPAYYRPAMVVEALSKLVTLRQEAEKWNTYNAVLFAIGNNHAGTYYPAILTALPLLIRLLKTTEHEIVRNCILEIFSEWYYSFEPELGTYKGIAGAELEYLVRSTIKNLIVGQTWTESKRNEMLIADFMSYFDGEAST